MRKVFSIFTLALLMLGITSCDSSNDIPKFTAELLNNSVNLSQGASEKVSSSSATIEWDVSNTTLSLSYSVPLNGSSVANVNLSNAKLTADNERNCYTFTAASVGSGITDLTGYFNPTTGCMHIEFMAGGYYVSSNADLVFPYCTITTTNTEVEGATPTENKDAVVLIKVNPTNMDALVIMYGIPLGGSSGTIQQVYFNGVKATATGNGYHLTLSEDLRSTDASYVLNSLDANVSANGLVINGNFVLDNRYNGTITGTQFAK